MRRDTAIAYYARIIAPYAFERQVRRRFYDAAIHSPTNPGLSETVVCSRASLASATSLKCEERR